MHPTTPSILAPAVRIIETFHKWDSPGVTNLHDGERGHVATGTMDLGGTVGGHRSLGGNRSLAGAR